jgi:hypothetical protein
MEDSIQKVTKAKKVGDMAQGLEFLPRKSRGPQAKPQYCQKQLKIKNKNE